MKYQSEIIKEIIDTGGHKKSSLHYESECIESWIEETKGAYPKLCDYQSEWLNYISILDDTEGSEKPDPEPPIDPEPDPDPEPPIGQFPYETLIDVTEATINNVVPYAYKSAILKGNTDENLQSVKMPVLKTKNKQTFVDFKEVSRGEGDFVVNSSSDGREVYITTPRWQSLNYVFDYEDGQSYTIKLDYETGNYVIDFYSVDGRRRYGIAGTGTIELDFIPQLTNGKLIEIQNNIYGGSLKLSNIELCPTSNKDEPYKTNILTVNEDVTLRSNGDICDELNLLTGQLTQRIGEDGVVLSQEVIKTVDLTVVNQAGENVSLKPIEGTMHLSTSSETINPLFSGEIPVEAITQNLASFIEE